MELRWNLQCHYNTSLEALGRQNCHFKVHTNTAHVHLCTQSCFVSKKKEGKKKQVHLQLTSLTSDCHEPVKVRQVYNVVTNNIESPRHSPQQFLGHPISKNHNMVVFRKVLLKSLIPQFPTALMVSFRNVNCTMRQFCINRNKETTNIKISRNWPVFYISPQTQGTSKYSQSS